MTSLLLRISHIAASEGITITSLEKSIGASKGVLSRAIKNNTDIQAKWLESIAHKYPQYSCSWLLTGYGDMYISSFDDTGSGDNYHQPSLEPKEEDNSPLSLALLKMLEHKDGLIMSQAEEIGRLKAENEILREENSRYVLCEKGGYAIDHIADTV